MQSGVFNAFQHNIASPTCSLATEGTLLLQAGQRNSNAILSSSEAIPYVPVSYRNFPPPGGDSSRQNTTFPDNIDEKLVDLLKQ